MKIAIVDDHQSEIARLSDILSRKLIAAGDTEHHIFPFSSGEAFLTSWTPGSYDLIILDIFMETLTGVDVARRIRMIDRDVRLVFCTTSNDFASESYEVGAHFYLRKPYSEEQVDTMLSRLNLENYELRRTIPLPDGQKIMLRNILYTEYSNHVLIIHSKRRADIRCYMTQTEAEALLCVHSYLRVCSKGIIVNLHEVEAKVADTFRLTDGSILPISRRKAKEVQDAYAAFQFEKMREEVPL